MAPHPFTVRTRWPVWSILSCGMTHTIAVRCLKGLSSRFVTEIRLTAMRMCVRRGFVAGSQGWVARARYLPVAKIMIAQAAVREVVRFLVLGTTETITHY